MVSLDNIEKIGDLNFKDFRTEFYILPKIKSYIEERGISLASLLPDGWVWYESILFECLNDEDEEFSDNMGKEFKTIYLGIVNKKDLGDDDSVVEEGFEETIDENVEIIQKSSLPIPGKEFYVRYIVVKK